MRTHRPTLLLILAVALATLGCDLGLTLPVDPDGDGWSAEDGDCANDDPTVYPGAPERCDGLDNDCDGRGDRDDDNDGVLGCFGCGATVACGDCDDQDATTHPGAPERCDGRDNNCDGAPDQDQDDDDACDPDDCDDTSAAVYPGAPERCNNQDDDCDGVIEDPGQDQDQDGHAVCGAQGDDCNDTDPTVHPGAAEVCNGRDDDCDGAPDDPEWSFDRDGDSTSDCIDDDLDGFTEQEGDCDDLARLTHPGAPEVAEGLDNDCDGAIDEEVGGEDLDGDAFTGLQGDCDDTNSAIHPGAPEACDGRDNNCDGQVDEGVLTSFYKDLDQDGFGTGAPRLGCVAPGPSWAREPGDCDDKNAAVNPDAPEVCDGLDNNCDGQVDGWPDAPVSWYPDGDGDGFGADLPPLISGCDGPLGYVDQPGDCDDSAPEVHATHDEWCADGLDNDCDGEVDETFAQADARAPTSAAPHSTVFYPHPQQLEASPMQLKIILTAAVLGGSPFLTNGGGCCTEQTYYYDADGDGYGDANAPVEACEAPIGYVEDNTDCNDRDPLTYPEAREACDGKDNNCNGEVDEDCGDGEILCQRTGGEWTLGCAPVTCANPNGDTDIQCLVAVELCRCPADAPYWDEELGCIPLEQCDVPVDQDGDGVSLQRGDCNDTNPKIYPGAPESCDSVDNDCDGEVDEGCSTGPRLCDATGGRWNECGSGCGPITCEDPREPDICPDVCVPQCECPADAPYWDEQKGCISERECGQTDDQDQDGYTEAQGDCDDTDPGVNPRAQEICDAQDNDCDGKVDEEGGRTFYADNDGDTYGNDATAVVSCARPPTGWVTVGGDCNDRDATINPGARELCDGIDNNCNGSVDEGTSASDPSCAPAPERLCDATGGDWTDCGSGCGPATCAAPVPGDVCPAVCVPQCVCPREAPLWDPVEGCIAKEECVSGDETLCKRTGGTWTHGCDTDTCENPTAGDSDCQAAIPLCDCPADAPYWDGTRGCITPDQCATR